MYFASKWVILSQKPLEPPTFLNSGSLRGEGGGASQISQLLGPISPNILMQIYSYFPKIIFCWTFCEEQHLQICYEYNRKIIFKKTWEYFHNFLWHLYTIQFLLALFSNHEIFSQKPCHNKFKMTKFLRISYRFVPYFKNILKAWWQFPSKKLWKRKIWIYSRQNFCWNWALQLDNFFSFQKENKTKFISFHVSRI